MDASDNRRQSTLGPEILAKDFLALRSKLSDHPSVYSTQIMTIINWALIMCHALSKSKQLVLIVVDWFVCIRWELYPHSNAVKLLPNSEDRALWTIVRGEFWLVPESGLMISAAPRRPASQSSWAPTWPSTQGGTLLSDAPVQCRKVPGP